jgi:hypothetical protein
MRSSRSKRIKVIMAFYPTDLIDAFMPEAVFDYGSREGKN